MDTKVCTKCKIFKELNEFSITKKGRVSSWCKACNVICSRNYYENNKQKAMETNRRYRKANHEKVLKASREYRKRTQSVQNKYSREYTKRLRERFLELYGNKCSCCGESEAMFLTIDHINGQVGIKRKEPSHTALIKAIKNFPSTEYRILCMNCNSAVRFGRVCPHQAMK